MTTEFTIRFHRSEQWEKRFEKAGVRKPAGMVISDQRYPTRDAAQHTADAVNAELPETPCKVMTIKNGVVVQ